MIRPESSPPPLMNEVGTEKQKERLKTEKRELQKSKNTKSSKTRKGGKKREMPSSKKLASQPQSCCCCCCLGVFRLLFKSMEHFGELSRMLQGRTGQEKGGEEGEKRLDLRGEFLLSSTLSSPLLSSPGMLLFFPHPFPEPKERG